MRDHSWKWWLSAVTVLVLCVGIVRSRETSAALLPTRLGDRSDIESALIATSRADESANAVEVQPTAGDATPIMDGADEWFADVDAPRTTGREIDRVLRVCRVTAYCDRGTTAAGVQSGLGQCAAPGDIPFGTLVYIPALDRTFVVTDRTHRRFRRSTVDLFLPSCDDCIQFGRNFLECEFILLDDDAAVEAVVREQPSGV